MAMQYRITRSTAKDPSLFSKNCAECAVAVLFCAPYVFLIIIVYDDDVLIVNIVP